MTESHTKNRRGLRSYLRAALDFYLHNAYALHRDSKLLQRVNIGKPYDAIVRTLPPFASVFPGTKDLRILEWGSNVTMTDGASTIRLKNNYARILLRERYIWDRLYTMPVAGKVVLDVGAGCGESAWFFFKRGAKKVIAVEPDSECVRFLETNRELNGWDMEIIHDDFRSAQLRIPHDFVKMDSEGGEIALLDDEVKEIGPCRLELHTEAIGQEATDRIIRKFGLKSIGYGYVWGKE